MTQPAKHTPTPQWKVERHDHEDGTIDYEIWEKEGYTRILSINTDFDTPQAKKHASMIVKAVNSHAMLLAALKYYAEGYHFKGKFADKDAAEDGHVARAAIEEAEGGA